MGRFVGYILLTGLACQCSAMVSTNVPLDHWSYEAVDKLIGYGLIDSAMMTTRPVSRFEMARHIMQAVEKAQRSYEVNEIILAIFDRLKKEFKGELVALGALEGNTVETFVKPVENPYIKYIFADEKPDIENQRGDVYRRNSNYRFGFASRMNFFDRAAIYLHPEYVNSSSESDGDVELIEGYGKVSIGPVELEMGKDSLWWGPGYRGSILMSNNTEPFKMFKLSNPHPVLLPWIFRLAGPFKAVWFLTELEKKRDFPEAKLTGLRFNFKPHPAFEMGLSRIIMFGGSGAPHVGLKDYVKMWRPQQEQAQTNQLAGFDVSVILPVDGIMPAKFIKLYGDFAGEDEAGWLPSKWARLYGMQLSDILRTGRTDLRIEYADTRVPGEAGIFYAHSLFTSGYTYKGRIIGYHTGTDSRDFSVRLTHYLTEDLILGLEFDQQERYLSSAPDPKINQLGFDLTLFTKNNWQINAGYRYEDSHNSSEDNHIFHLDLTYNF